MPTDNRTIRGTVTFFVRSALGYFSYEPFSRRVGATPRWTSGPDLTRNGLASNVLPYVPFETVDAALDQCRRLRPSNWNGLCVTNLKGDVVATPEGAHA